MSAERCWRDWAASGGWPVAPHVDGRVVVLSAHPDDEVLALGGTLARQCWGTVRFCTATDGEACHPGSPTLSPDELACTRRRELRQALAVLGHADAEVSWFGLPDSALADSRSALERLVRAHTEQADLVLCPLSTDGHADHDVLGAVTIAVCAGRVPVWQYPIWAWDRSAPGDPRVPWQAVHLLPLDPDAQARKQQAVRCFRSQIRPLSEDPADRAVLTAETLAHFDRPFEVVFR